MRRLTHREWFNLESVTHFVSYLKLLEKEIGKKQVIASLQKFAIQQVEEYAEYVVQANGKNELSVFKEDDNPNTPGIKEIRTIEVTEDTDEA